MRARVGHPVAVFLKRNLAPNLRFCKKPFSILPNGFLPTLSGVGKMSIDQVRFKLQLVYDRCKIDLTTKAISNYPKARVNRTSFVVFSIPTNPTEGRLKKLIMNDFVS